MKAILILSLLLFSSQISKNQHQVPKLQPKKQPEVQRILAQVKKNHPKLDQTYSRKLAETIVKKAKKHGVSPKILAAILMQESGYKISAKNFKCGVSVTTGEKDCVAVDLGIGQINVRTIKNFKFDQKKLLSDLTYSIEASAIVLADFKRMYGKKEQEWWTRYNASSPSKRQAYKILVARHM